MVRVPLAVLPGSSSAQQQASSLPQHQFIEPTEYPSDLPVSQEMLEKKASGPGERYPLPDGSKHTYLPVFDPAFFGEDVRALIPSNWLRRAPRGIPGSPAHDL